MAAGHLNGFGPLKLCTTIATPGWRCMMSRHVTLVMPVAFVSCGCGSQREPLQRERVRPHSGLPTGLRSSQSPEGVATGAGLLWRAPPIAGATCQKGSSDLRTRCQVIAHDRSPETSSSGCSPRGRTTPAGLPPMAGSTAGAGTTRGSWGLTHCRVALCPWRLDCPRRERAHTGNRCSRLRRLALPSVGPTGTYPLVSGGGGSRVRL